MQPTIDDPRVVTGTDRVEAEGERAIENCAELDALIATHTWVRGATGGVLGNEVVDNVAPEPLRDIPDIEGDAQHISGTTRITRVLERTAAARALAERCR